MSLFAHIQKAVFFRDEARTVHMQISVFLMKDLSLISDDNSRSVVIPPANCVCGRVYCFHVVRRSERTNENVSVTFCFLNILKGH